jgi:hypothetical protein
MMRRALRPSSLLSLRGGRQQASRALSVQPVVEDVVEVTHTPGAGAQQQQQQQPQPSAAASGFQGETRVLGGAKAVLRNVSPLVRRWGWAACIDRSLRHAFSLAHSSTPPLPDAMERMSRTGPARRSRRCTTCPSSSSSTAPPRSVSPSLFFFLWV